MSAPLPSGDSWKDWGERLVDYIKRTATHLVFKTQNITAKDDGIILWDRAGYPVVSKNGDWRQIILADGYASYSRSTDQLAAAINTAYPIDFDTISFENGMSIGVDNHTITF
ncbi:MAG TPA: hypothetical protein VLA24_09965, partial [Pseudomonadales bacterium]|nr:hypothetical protein [Pseudomonadales bacterium]